MRKPKVRDQKYYDVLEKHVLELMKNGVTLPKWHALQVKLAEYEKQMEAYLAPGVSWDGEAWVNNAAKRLEQDLQGVKAQLEYAEAEVDRVRAENASLQRAYVRPDDLRAQVEEGKAKLEAELKAREAGVERLRVAIEAAEAAHRAACLNGSNAMQVACITKVDHLKQAMALVLQG